ncbi:uncharacterized protein OCT59_010035 [Rhizophagus irregularis]|uniref:uncharacterized protein n=1 Tax=Rhizophagus irregularis TaxID=588596 RepID=UPI003321E946|nr:hypothetical protein OCT59_010035 [Rhizophagus irregularis]
MEPIKNIGIQRFRMEPIKDIGIRRYQLGSLGGMILGFHVKHFESNNFEICNKYLYFVCCLLESNQLEQCSKPLTTCKCAVKR